MTDQKENKTYFVHIPDPSDTLLLEMPRFIVDAELNLISCEELDVSDVSYTTDVLVTYEFSSEQDALLFYLRFGDKTP